MTEEPTTTEFSVTLRNFEGPFDLLLQLISQHQLDITEVALSAVTTEFIAYVRTLDDDLEAATHFLLVAATLLDLKTSRLLPRTEVEDEEDLALLEARDLLFARLMQYRAFKAMASVFADRLAIQSRRFGRDAVLEERFALVMPEVTIRDSLTRFAERAANALRPKEPPVLSLAHLHAPAVSVREQGHLIVSRLRRDRSATFRALTADAPDVQTKVARFLALLELFREGVLAFDQAIPLGELTVRWTGRDDVEVEVGDEFDGSGPEAETLPDPQPEREQVTLEEEGTGHGRNS